MKFSFLEAGISHYLDSSNTPEESEKKSVQTEWKNINSCIIGTLGRHIAPALAEELREDMSATEAWSLLKKRTQQDGIFAKLNTMHVAICTKFSHNMPTIDTLSELKSLLACIYKGRQAPTQEEWSIVLMLNALEGSDSPWKSEYTISECKNHPQSKRSIQYHCFFRLRAQMEDQ